MERTIVDSIKDMDKISGIEEVVQNIESVHRMQEKRLLKYLELFQNQFLYQKMGCLLWQYKEQMGLSDSFFEKCKKLEKANVILHVIRMVAVMMILGNW